MPANKFIWYELMTTDPVAAASFYRHVVGWESQDSGQSGLPYKIWTLGDERIGGLMELPAEARERGAMPGWIGYIAVDDVDGYTARVSAAGGAVHRPPADIPGVGRFAVVGDPHGAPFVLFRGLGEPPPPAAADAPGHIGWHELHAGDLDAAFAFYSDLFGWTKAEAIDMGPLGVYQLFATGEAPVGGMMKKMAVIPRAFWAYYLNVEAVDAAVERTTAAGGTVLMGPQQVPTGQWIVQCLDPQGAFFALLSAKR